MSFNKKTKLKGIIFIILILAGSAYFFKDELLILKNDNRSSIDQLYVDSDGVEHMLDQGWFPEVSTSFARFYVGKHKEICGKVTQEAVTRKGAFINFGDRYPNHDFSIVIWGEVEKKDLPHIGQHLCVKGLVSEYNGKPQIELKTLNAQIYYKED